MTLNCASFDNVVIVGYQVRVT